MAQRLHTAWCDYLATGEGRTITALIAYARDEAHMREHIRDHFGQFWAEGLYVSQGVVRNPVTEYLWPGAVLNFLERCEGEAGAVLAKSQLHVNFS